jgi:hypothetical protein
MAFKMKGMNFGKDTGSFAKKTAVERMEEQMSKGSGMVDRRREQLGLKPKAEARAERLARKTAKLEGKMEGASDRKKARLQRRIDAKTRRIGVKPTETKTETKTEVKKPKPTEVKTKTKLYSDLPESQRAAAKAYNMKTYGTNNPTAKAKKLGITKAELAKKYKSKPVLSDLSKTSIGAPKDDVTDLLTGKSTMKLKKKKYKK